MKRDEAKFNCDVLKTGAVGLSPCATRSSRRNEADDEMTWHLYFSDISNLLNIVITLLMPQLSNNFYGFHTNI